MTVHDLKRMTQAEFETRRDEIFKALWNPVGEIVETPPAQPRYKIPSPEHVVKPVLSKSQQLERMSQREFEQRYDEIKAWARDGLLHDGRG